MDTRLMRLDDAAAVGLFVTRLQADPAHMIAYFGSTLEDIVGQLRAFDPNPARATLLAYEGERLLGLLGIDLSVNIRKAWLYAVWPAGGGFALGLDCRCAVPAGAGAADYPAGV
jgi:hypothetical protein